MDTFNEKAIDDGLRSTKALIQTFLQTVKSFRLYETEHPILLRFLDRLKKDFDRYFEEFDSFSLQVGEHQLFYQGKVVYESQDVKESLAFAFFRDGIREIRFFKGLEFREMIDFLNIVRKGDFVNRLEDDLVTLIWEKNFTHLSFTTVEEFLEEADNLVPATVEELVKGLQYKGSGEEGLGEKANGAVPLMAAEDRKGQPFIQACQLHFDEMEEVRREVQREEEPDFFYVLIDNLIEVLLHLGDEVEAYENMISYFERTVESILDQGEVGKAAGILEKLNETSSLKGLKDTQTSAIRRILDASSNAHSIELLGKAMNNNGEKDPESIARYLRFVTPQAIDPLCRLLRDLESENSKKWVCDSLVGLCRKEIQPLTKFLSDPNPALVCHILRILGKVKHPGTAEYLGGLVNHADPKIREETLQVVAQLGDKGRPLIRRLLVDPVADIRAKASFIFARTGRDQALKPLLEIVLSKDFYKRDYKEKFSFFGALRETGSKEAILILEKIAKKRRWFQKAKWDEMRLCASSALKMMRS